MMLHLRHFSSFFIVFLLCAIVDVLNHDGFLFVHANTNLDHEDSMTVELIHRDSLEWHGNQQRPSKTLRQIVKERHLRDISRQEVHYPLRKNDGIAWPMESGSDLGIGQYMANVHIGTPPRKYMLVVDTGSDVTWINCRYKCGRACRHRQGRILRDHDNVFYADRSSSFKPIPCSSNQCKNGLRDMRSMAPNVCPTPSSHCRFNISYLGGKIAMGFLAEEIIRAPLTTTGRTMKLHHMVIGCTDTVVQNLHGDGILGLGLSLGSFTDKTSRSFGPKFSYCLMNWQSPMNVKSYITFGVNKKAPLHGPIARTSFFVPNPGHYGVNVSGVSVGGKLLNIPRSLWQYNEDGSNGGTILDSGTANTWLAEEAFDAVMAEYDKALSKFKRSPADPMIPFDVCFKSADVDLSSVPKLGFHFVDGAVFEPPVRNLFLYVSSEDMCLGLVKSSLQVGSLIGNHMQQNYLWDFDLGEETVGFTPSSCT